MSVLNLEPKWELVEEVVTPEGKVETFSKPFPSLKTIRRVLKESALPGWLTYKLMKFQKIEANLRGAKRTWHIREIK